MPRKAPAPKKTEGAGRKGKPPPVTTPAAVQVVERQAEAVKLRVEGKTLQEIADQLGYSDPSGAHRAIAAALAKTLATPADEFRALELERLEALWKGLWRFAQAGDEKAVSAALKVMQRRAKLMGLDARPEARPDTPTARDVVAEMREAADHYERTNRPPGGGDP